MSDLNSVIAEMLKDPPDPNGPVPIANRTATMYSAVIPFHIIAWIAVIARLYTRYFIVRDPGLDDYFIIFASLVNLAGMMGYIGGILNRGLGHHLIYLGQDKLLSTMMWLYIVGVAYALTTTLVKVSLLCQYLRLFRTGPIRTVCHVLLVLVGIWGSVYCFMSIFPCFPVRGFWDRSLTTAKCYGIGFGNIQAAKAGFISFASTNMAFDIAIFLVPMVEYLKRDIGRKQLLAFTGLFTIGAVVVVMSVLRLWTTVRNGNSPLAVSVDFTWWYPLTLMISCIELDFALICASMPIFWPNMVGYLAQIFVVNEVHVTHHSRVNDGENSPSNTEYELDLSRSWKANTSQENLTRVPSQTKPTKTDYQDRYVVEHVTGKVQERTHVQVGPVPKKSWRG